MKHPSGRQTIGSPGHTVARRASFTERHHLERRGINERKKKVTDAENSGISRWVGPGRLQPGQAGRLKGGL